MVSRTVSAAAAAGTSVVAQTQNISYPTPVAPPGGLPANFARPTQVKLSQSAVTSSSGVRGSAARTTTTATAYDDHGRVTSATDEAGTVTDTTYDDAFGLVTKQLTTGTDGTRAQVDNALTADGRSIQQSTTSVGTVGGSLAARQTIAYTYDSAGQLSLRQLRWAPGAKPAQPDRGGGPDEIVTNFERSAPAADGTQKVTVTTGFGTDAAQANTVTVDLASGLAVAHADALERPTVLRYDAIGRRTRSTTPDGLTTTTAYTPTQTTVTAADGRVSRTTTDLLGRTVSLTDNVQSGKLTTDPGARTLATSSYSADGSSVTATDQAGRTTRRALDAFGRTVSSTGPFGLTTLTTFDDGAAHSRVTSMVPEGSTSPQLSTVASFDDLGRPVQSRTSFPAGNGTGGRPGDFVSEPVSAASFDGLGQRLTTTADDVTVATDRSGPGGVSTAATASPQQTADLPGAPITAVTTRSLSGAATSRTLQQGDDTSTAVAVEYDASGNVVASVDPENRTTTYSYAPDGQVLTKTTPSGTVTTNTYDDDTGQLRTTTVTAPDKPTRTVSFTWVPNGQLGAGLVKSTTDSTGTMTYGYDAGGNKISVSYPDGTTTRATYNDAGQLATTTDVTGAVTSYEYDPATGSMVTATQRRAGAVLASVSYGYDPMGRIETTTRGNDTVTRNTYTGNNLLAGQVTTDDGDRTIEAHSYTYDSHRNVLTRTDTYAPGTRVAVPGGPSTWSTLYSYDAYDRLTGSATYPGSLVNGAPTTTATTSTRYAVDVGGDVTTTTTTRRLPGVRPVVITTTRQDTIDDSGRLSSRRTGQTTATQSFDDDGRLTRRLDGMTLSYTTDGAPQRAQLADGSTITYTRWPDGSRRSATTTAADGHTSTIVLHYGTDDTLVNDSTADSSAAAGRATTASYLITAGREARTLLPNTAGNGSVTGTPATPVDGGAGVGYYLRDRHSSVTALLDASGAATAGYAYADYGAPVRADGQPITLTGSDGGRVNPFTFLGATPKGPWSEAGSGLLDFGSRSYDPGQGRFISPDPVDAHNLYQGFRTNPIMYTDIGGRVPGIDALIDVGFAFVFLATAILTGGAAAAAIGAAAAAAEVGVAVTSAVVVNATAAVLGTVANLTGAVTSGLLAADDLSKAAGKGQVLNAEDRDTVTLVNAVAGVTAGASGAVQGFTDAAVEALEVATAARASRFEVFAKAAKAENSVLRGLPPDTSYVAPAKPARIPAVRVDPNPFEEAEPADLGSLFGDDEVADPAAEGDDEQQSVIDHGSEDSTAESDSDDADSAESDSEQSESEVEERVLVSDNASGTESDEESLARDRSASRALALIESADPAVKVQPNDVTRAVRTSDQISENKLDAAQPGDEPDVDDFIHTNLDD